MTYGDRVFRTGNLHRAAERYEQAMAADPASAAPRLRLAQVALVRGQYSEAANRFREAQSLEPNWLVNAPDVQSLYSEPADFARQISRLESHLHAQPGDRDAWLVLGAQWYLSGQSRKASDVFLRLSDRKGDAVLAAFLEASTPRGPDPK
jgi:cytochrome c-type biogenesis protein CcmH/NrfG